MAKQNKAGTELSQNDSDLLLAVLKSRFEKNIKNLKGINWNEVEAKLKKQPGKLWSLQQMENTGGEPGLVEVDGKTGEYVFFDCAGESPKGRRSLCFDEAALASRKENKPNGSAEQMAEQMQIEILTESQYRRLQQMGEFDTKTSSWIQTPAEVRKLGGALFCDRRYNQVFLYHNGAESYYAARGFRGCLKV